MQARKADSVPNHAHKDLPDLGGFVVLHRGHVAHAMPTAGNIEGLGRDGVVTEVVGRRKQRETRETKEDKGRQRETKRRLKRRAAPVP